MEIGKHVENIAVFRDIVIPVAVALVMAGSIYATMQKSISAAERDIECMKPQIADHTTKIAVAEERYATIIKSLDEIKLALKEQR